MPLADPTPPRCDRPGASAAPGPRPDAAARAAAVLGLCALFFAAVAATGGWIDWRLGSLQLLSSYGWRRPLAVAAACGLALAWRRRRRPEGFRAAVSAEALRRPLASLLLASAVLAGLSGDLPIHGDGVEYIVQTQAIVLDRSLAIDTGKRADYWNRTAPHPVRLGPTRPPHAALDERTQAGGSFGGLYADRSGDYRYYHFWAYSAFVAPVYAALHAVDGDRGLEYHAFRLVNVGLLACLFLMAWGGWPGAAALAASVAALFTPLVALCDWQHPELFCLTLTFAAFWLAGRGGRAALAGPLLLGIAASQNAPIALFFPLHLAWTISSRGGARRRDAAALALAYGAGAAAVLAAPLYFEWHFGVPSVIAAVGLADPGYAGLGRVADMFLSPLVGVLWIAPAWVLFAPATCSRKTLWLVAGAALSVAAAAYLASGTRNFNAGQVGTLRYLVWLTAPLQYAGAVGLSTGAARGGARGAAPWLAAALCGLLAWQMGSGALFAKDLRRFDGSWRGQPEVAAVYRVFPYPDDPETFAENVEGREIRRPPDFNRVYIWNLGAGRSLWIISGRALGRLRTFAVPSASLPRLRAEPAGAVRFSLREGRLHLRRGEAPPAIHPVLGPYVRVRMAAEVGEVRSNVPVRVLETSGGEPTRRDGLRPERPARIRRRPDGGGPEPGGPGRRRPRPRARRSRRRSSG